MERETVDHLTGIHNEEYLKRVYQCYLNDNPNSIFIMIDFEKFKRINDSFGHNVGDEYLKTFAEILESNFKNSIVVRLHGDEFAVLTNYDEDTISKIFQLCDQKIELAVLQGRIPETFGYNAGSTMAEHGINVTKEKADYMMYFAKKKGIRYQRFSKEILQEKIVQDEYLSLIDNSLKKGEFTYISRQLFDQNDVGQNIFQIYTRGKDGCSIFDNGRYDILKRTSKLPQFDVYNVQFLLERLAPVDYSIIITIDYKSLIFADTFLKYFTLFECVSAVPFKNIILSIDLNGIELASYQAISRRINELKALGFKLRLEKFNSSMGDLLWEESNVDYIKIANNYWKNAMNNSKIFSSLEAKIQACASCSIIPIFEFVEKKEEHNFLRDFAPSSSLFSGDFYSKEIKLLLKK